MLRPAFFNQYNLILLGGAILYALALASPVPLAMGLAGEILWLAVGANSAAFRRWVTADALRHDEARWRQKVEAAVAASALEPALAGRLRATGASLVETLRAVDAAGGGGGAAGQELEALFDAYGQMVAASQRLGRMIGDGRATAIEEEQVRLAKAVAEERDATVRVSLRQALALGQRRLKQIEQVEGARRALEIKMGAFEASLDHLRAMLATGARDEQILADLSEMLAAARVGPEIEAEAARVLAPSPRATGSMPIAGLRH